MQDSLSQQMLNLMECDHTDRYAVSLETSTVCVTSEALTYQRLARFYCFSVPICLFQVSSE